mgnify:CR=1 FL=1
MKNLRVPDKAVVVETITAVLPKASPLAIRAFWTLFKGLSPVSAAVRLPAVGKSATAMARRLLASGDPTALRHAKPLLDTFVGSYSTISIDEDRLRSRATMAIGKVANGLRDRGYTVGVACPTVDGIIYAVPYVIDSRAVAPKG